MGLFGDDEAPLEQTAKYDPYTEELLKKQTRDALAPKEEGYANIDKNLQVGSDLFDQGTQKGFLGQGVDTAIKQKYKGLLDKDLGGVRTKARLGLRETQLDNLKRAQHAMLAQQAVHTQAMSNYMQAQTMRETARAQTLRGILGFGVAAGGFGLAMAMQNKSGSPGGTPESQNPTSGMTMDSSYGKGLSEQYRAGNLYADTDSFKQRGIQQSQNYKASLEEYYG